LEHSIRRRPDHPAVVDPTSGQEITFAALDRLSDRLRDRLRERGVRPGDRVGIYLRKSIDSVASIFGILKAGASYVPADPTAPTSRSAYIFSDCSVSAVIVEAAQAKGLQAGLEQHGAAPPLLVLEPAENGLALEACLERENEKRGTVAPSESVVAAPDDLAYILYTSGSTGKPKGVMLSHANATSFVNWCSDALEPCEDDRFSSHAPFHFDLSVLDVYVPIKHGATVFLIGEDLGKNPAGMVEMMTQRRLTVWYSTPSVLTLLMEHGGLAEHDDHALRMVIFAGEVFPVKHLRRLRQILPGPRFFNLYGPTETNVCTYYEIPETIPDDRVQPYPIGTVCSQLKARVIDGRGRDVQAGEEGELVISGPNVMQGYWNLADNTAAAFLEDDTGRWYKTGDIVIEGEGGVYSFVGRRDRMVKRRGYRVELGEIEATLYRHPAISEAASIALSDDKGVLIKAFYGTRDGTALSIIELKRFCSENLPLYMIPDRFSHQERLPKTSTDKVDYQRLKELD
jgi:amino acid adenylation domain-containing protein